MPRSYLDDMAVFDAFMPSQKSQARLDVLTPRR